MNRNNYEQHGVGSDEYQGDGGGRRDEDGYADESRIQVEEWVQYVVEIRGAKRVKKKGPNGEFLDPFEYEIVPVQRRDAEKIVDTTSGGNPLSRKILDQLQQNLWKNEGKLLVSDGRRSAYSTNRLFERSDETTTSENSADEEEKTTETSNSTTPSNLPLTPQIGPYKTFVVRIKKDWEDKDSHDVQEKTNYYLVRLTEVCVIPSNLVRQLLENQIPDLEQVEHLRQLANTVSI